MINEKNCRDKQLNNIDRRDYHLQHSQPAMQQILELREQQRTSEQGEQPIVEPDSNLCRAMYYFIKHYIGLYTFCTNQGAPVDNNNAGAGHSNLSFVAEKTACFIKQRSALTFADVICSVLAICHEHDVDAQHYLVSIQQSHLQVKASLETWLQWNCTSSRSTAERR